MPIFAGNLNNSSAVSTAYNIPSTITDIHISNKSGGTVHITVGIFYGSTIYYLLYGHTVAANDNYEHNSGDVLVLKNYQIFVSSDGQSDFYFTIE